MKVKNPILGKLRQDDDGHWYLIPNLYFRTFDVLVAKLEKLGGDPGLWYERQNIVEELEKNFDKYRLDGGPFDLDVIMPGP